MKDTGQGLYGTCPYCKHDGRTLLVTTDTAFCSNCKIISTFEALLTEMLSMKGCCLSLVPRHESHPTFVQNLLWDVCNYYRFNYLHHPRSKEVREYTEHRGLTPQSRKEFLIGFAPDRRTQLRHGFPGRAYQSVLIEQGLVVEDFEHGARNYDRFASRLMFPIQNLTGAIIGFGGRLFDDSSGAKYLNSPETSLFSKSSELYGLYNATEHIKEDGAAIIVEGYLDVIALHQYGFKTAVATMGTALTEQHAKTLFERCNYIYLCFDSDRAGVKAITKAIDTCAPMLSSKNRRLMICLMANGDDPDSLLRRSGSGAFKDVLGAAISPVNFIFNHETSAITLTDDQQLAKVLNRLRILLNTKNPRVLKDTFDFIKKARPELSAQFIKSLIRVDIG